MPAARCRRPRERHRHPDDAERAAQIGAAITLDAERRPVVGRPARAAGGGHVDAVTIGLDRPHRDRHRRRRRRRREPAAGRLAAVRPPGARGGGRGVRRRDARRRSRRRRRRPRRAGLRLAPRPSRRHADRCSPASACRSRRTRCAPIVLPAVRGCDWLHLGSQWRRDFPAETIAVLAGAGHRLCLDGQGPARGAEPGPVRLRPFPPESIAGVAILKLNRARGESPPRAIGSTGRRPARPGRARGVRDDGRTRESVRRPPQSTGSPRHGRGVLRRSDRRRRLLHRRLRALASRAARPPPEAAARRRGRTPIGFPVTICRAALHNVDPRRVLFAACRPTASAS